MAQRTTFAKLQRERAKKMKAEEKRARRQGQELAPATTERAPAVSRGPRVPQVDGHGKLSPDELLRLVSELNEAYEAGLLDEDEFEEKKLILMDRV